MNKLSLILLEERIVLDGAAAAVIYVNAHAASGGDGSSWAHAYNNLQSALTKAASTTAAEQIWIAQGTYTPTQIYSPNGVLGGASGLNDPHLATFNLPNNVSLYGGFAGNETSLSQRNPTIHPTILSGDILGNDASPGSANFASSKADNVWHVVTAGNDIADTGVKATLDGLSIVGGYAAGPDSGNVDPNGVVLSLAYTHDSGGGLYARFGSNLSLNNVSFLGDYASVSSTPLPFVTGGGAIFATDTGTFISINHSLLKGNSAPGAGPTTDSGQGGAIDLEVGAGLTITNSTLALNAALRDGGAIRTANASAVTLTNDVFDHNTASGGIPTSSGGAISALNTTLTIESSSFTGNTAVTDPTTPSASAGGALFIHNVFEGPIAHPTLIDSSTFTNNSATGLGGVGAGAFGGGAIFALGILPNPGSVLTLTNSIFTGNSSGEGGAVHVDSHPATLVNDIFLNNSSTQFGGALASSGFFNDFFGAPQFTVNVSNSLFSGNSVTLDPFSPVAFAGTFAAFGIAYDNATVSGGGAVVNHMDGNLMIDSSVFLNNTANNLDAGAILNGGALGHPFSNLSVNTVQGGNLTVTHSIFTLNKGLSGGAIESIGLVPISDAKTPTLSVTKSIFSLNKATLNGGAFSIKSSVATITKNILIADSANGLGDEVFGSTARIDGGLTSDPNTANALKLLNTIIGLDSDDIVLA